MRVALISSRSASRYCASSCSALSGWACHINARASSSASSAPPPSAIAARANRSPIGTCARLSASRAAEPSSDGSMAPTSLSRAKSARRIRAAGVSLGRESSALTSAPRSRRDDASPSPCRMTSPNSGWWNETLRLRPSRVMRTRPSISACSTASSLARSDRTSMSRGSHRLRYFSAARTSGCSCSTRPARSDASSEVIAARPRSCHTPLTCRRVRAARAPSTRCRRNRALPPDASHMQSAECSSSWPPRTDSMSSTLCSLVNGDNVIRMR